MGWKGHGRIAVLGFDSRTRCHFKRLNLRGSSSCGIPAIGALFFDFAAFEKLLNAVRLAFEMHLKLSAIYPRAPVSL